MAEPIRLPRLLKEREAADALGVSVDTLRRERRRNRIGFTMIGGRVRYTEGHLAHYIEDRSIEPCGGRDRTSASRSENTGSLGGPTAAPGAGPGSTNGLDRHAAHLSARMILSGRS